jgi:hypothetical protein
MILHPLFFLQANMGGDNKFAKNNDSWVAIVELWPCYTSQVG